MHKCTVSIYRDEILLKPSLKYIYQKVLLEEPRACLVDEDAWKFSLEWVSMVASDAVGRNGFLYLLESDATIVQPAAGDVAYACVLAQSQSRQFAGVPRIVVPDECRMDALFNRVVDEVDRFRHWDEAVNQILLGGASMQDVLEATYALVPRPMYLADVFWRMTAHVDSGMDEMSSHWLHEIRHGCLSTSVTEQLNESGEYRSIAESNRAFLVETQAFNNNYVAKAIKYRGKLLGFFFIIDMWKDLGPCEIEIADKLGKLLGPLLGSGREGAVVEDHRGQGLAALLDCSNVNIKHLASALATTTGWRVEGDWRLAAACINESEQVSPMVRMRIESLLGSGFDSIVIPTDDMSFVAYCCSGKDGRKLMSHLQDCVNTLGRTVLLSGRFTHFATASLYFRQFKALSKARVWHEAAGEATVVTYDTLFPALLARWCTHKLPPAFEVDVLASHDAAHGTDYVRTLYTYLKHERNTVATAKALFLHRNSMHNRIEKILNLIDVDLDDSEVRLRLLVSLMARVEG